MAYPVGTRIKLIQEDGLFNVGVILERVTVEPYSVGGRRGTSTEGWKVIHTPEEGVGWALHLPMLETIQHPGIEGEDNNEYIFKYPVEEEREGVAFEISNELLVGDRVYIHPESRFYGMNGLNPKEVEGTVSAVTDCRRMGISVIWDNTAVNCYTVEDLELASVHKDRIEKNRMLRDFSLRGRIKETISKMEKAPFIGHTRYSIISAAPEWHQGIEHGACHAAVNRSEVPKRFCIISSINFRKIDERGSSRENIIMYYDWLFNRSPLRSAFLTKKAEKAVQQGYVITSCKPAANLMQSANVALRQPWEQHSIVVDLFAGMAKAGVNENLAFVLAHYITYDRSNPQIINYPGGMHRVFDWSMASNQSVADWINDKLRNLTESYRTNNNFGGGDNLIAKKGKEKAFDGDSILRSFPAPAAKQKTTAHVFAAAKSSGSIDAVSLDVRIDWLVDIHKKVEEAIAS